MDENRLIQQIVGENIRKHRQANHLTLDALAKFLGITPGFLGLIERGKRGVSFKNLFKLSEVLNIPLDQFFLETEEKIDTEELFDKPQNIKIKIIKKLDNLEENELLFILKTILSLLQLKNSNK